MSGVDSYYWCVMIVVNGCIVSFVVFGFFYSEMVLICGLSFLFELVVNIYVESLEIDLNSFVVVEGLIFVEFFEK